jgi:hypothetical protein
MTPMRPKSHADCRFFLTNSCTKGEECQFRHHEPAKTNYKNCVHWLKGSCKNGKVGYV